MNKTLKTCLSTLAIVVALSSVAFADGDAFTPLNFDDTSYKGKAEITTPVLETEEMPVGSAKMENAIIELDNAQVDVRNELLNAKTKYSEVDAQYVSVKAERKALDKQIKTTEKRIKEIDKTKEKIRKNLL
ncbi:MAG: hypothetical protein R3Y28_00865 [Candidatus Gastranaerophilales bacterium]